MKINVILREARLSPPILAKAAGVKLGYLKQLSAGNSEAGPDARHKIADAFERHAEALKGYAAELRADPDSRP